jgi:hypothetical protein
VVGQARKGGPGHPGDIAIGKLRQFVRQRQRRRALLAIRLEVRPSHGTVRLRIQRTGTTCESTWPAVARNTGNASVAKRTYGRSDLIDDLSEGPARQCPRRFLTRLVAAWREYRWSCARWVLPAERSS